MQKKNITPENTLGVLKKLLTIRCLSQYFFKLLQVVFLNQSRTKGQKFKTSLTIAERQKLFGERMFIRLLEKYYDNNAQKKL